MKLLFLLLFLPLCANAATRDFILNYTHGCETVDGDSLDTNGDGICDQLLGWRFYTEAGGFIEGLDNPAQLTHTIRYNAPWGTNCHLMTATMLHPIDGTLLESAFSNLGACLDVVPGNPNAPVVTN